MAKRPPQILAPLALLWLAGAPVLGATLNVADLSPNALVITEYLANPLGISDADGEYFEIYNTTNHHLDLDGLIVRDDGSNSFTIASVVAMPHAFVVLSSSDGSSLGFSPDYVYGSGMTLTNSDDEIGLYRPDDTLINKVSYSDGDQFGAGIAHELAMLSGSTPTLLYGPALGTDFVAASGALPFGNTGSPGSAGNTMLNVPTVPLPAGVWMLLSALSMLGWTVQRRPARDRQPGDPNVYSRLATDFVPGTAAGGDFAGGLGGVRP